MVLKWIWKYIVMMEDVLALTESVVLQNVNNYGVLQKLPISLNRDEITVFSTYSYSPLF